MTNRRFVIVTLLDQSLTIIAVSSIKCVTEGIYEGPHGDKIKACRVYMIGPEFPKYIDVVHPVDEMAKLISGYDEVR